jgi:hypothetical protein
MGVDRLLQVCSLATSILGLIFLGGIKLQSEYFWIPWIWLQWRDDCGKLCFGLPG